MVLAFPEDAAGDRPLAKDPSSEEPRSGPIVVSGRASTLRRAWDSPAVRLRRIFSALRSLRSLRVKPTLRLRSANPPWVRAKRWSDLLGPDHRLVLRYGGGGIRTHEGFRPPVFKYAATSCLWLPRVASGYRSRVSHPLTRRRVASGCISLTASVGKTLASARSDRSSGSVLRSLGSIAWVSERLKRGRWVGSAGSTSDRLASPASLGCSSLLPCHRGPNERLPDLGLGAVSGETRPLPAGCSVSG